MNTKKKNIWILLPNLGTGGAEIFLTSISKEIGSTFNVEFFINSEQIDINTSSLHINTHKSSLIFILNLLKRARKEKPDFLLSSIIDMNLLTLSLKLALPKGTKLIIREALCHQSACEVSRFPKAYQSLAKWLYPKADGILCLSEELRNSLQLAIPSLNKKNNLFILNNGVQKNRISNFPLPLPLKNTVVAVGRLEHQKGFDVLISAFSEFRLKHPDFKLNIIGTGTKKDELQNQIKKLNEEENIKLLGNIDNPIAQIRKSSFLVISSRYEGLSNVMLEALTNGVPVLSTSEKTSAKEIINESNGFVVQACSKKDLLFGLEKISQNAASFSRIKIASEARVRYDIRVAANRLKLILDRL
ncbi:glycosyltransferase [Marinobacter sp. SS21]|uniref:glycosyltransferase n=1 Tax=Marinobacter sp. SS21 TaxID=2979460 RepID=UPI00232BB5A7|nr:glycosyltransferase [Marinobacter sp. SS21]MDC0661789.1 glycosyltransferase [Marinobacter sp. SS21]